MCMCIHMHVCMFIFTFMFIYNKHKLLMQRLPDGSMVNNLHAKQEMQETRVQSLSWEDPLEKGMATHSSILAWEVPWTEELGALQSMGPQKSDTT